MALGEGRVEDDDDDDEVIPETLCFESQKNDSLAHLIGSGV